MVFAQTCQSGLQYAKGFGFRADFFYQFLTNINIFGIKKHFAGKWQQQWRTYQTQHLTAGQKGELGPKRLRMHNGLEKAVSSLAVQEKIGLADFLFRRRVLGVGSAACQCGFSRQTIKHVLMFCLNYADRSALRAGGSIN